MVAALIAGVAAERKITPETAPLFMSWVWAVRKTTKRDAVLRVIITPVVPIAIFTINPDHIVENNWNGKGGLGFPRVT